MKYYFYSLLIALVVSFSANAQNKECQIDYEIKNDTINFVKTKEVMLYEKDFAKTTKSVFMSVLKSDEMYFVDLQYLQKNPDFIPITCINYKSLVSIKLLSGRIVNCYYVGDEKCDNLLYDNQEKNNIRILTGTFILRKEDVPFLKESPITTMQIRFAGRSEQFIIREEIDSNITNENSKPSRFFIDSLKCIE